jgi:hypothetical protein
MMTAMAIFVGRISQVIADNHRNIWVVGERGLFHLNQETGQITRPAPDMIVMTSCAAAPHPVLRSELNVAEETSRAVKALGVPVRIHRLCLNKRHMSTLAPARELTPCGGNDGCARLFTP